MKKIIVVFIAIFFFNNNVIAIDHVFKNGMKTEIRGISLGERLRESHWKNENSKILVVKCLNGEFVRRTTLANLQKANPNPWTIPSHPTDDFIGLVELIYSAELNLATYCYHRNAIIYGVADCSYCNMFEVKRYDAH